MTCCARLAESCCAALPVASFLRGNVFSQPELSGKLPKPSLSMCDAHAQLHSLIVQQAAET